MCYSSSHRAFILQYHLFSREGIKESLLCQTNEEGLIKISLAEDLSRLLLTDEHGYAEVNPVCVSASSEISGIVRRNVTKLPT